MVRSRYESAVIVGKPFHVKKADYGNHYKHNRAECWTERTVFMRGDFHGHSPPDKNVFDPYRGGFKRTITLVYDCRSGHLILRDNRAPGIVRCPVYLFV